MAGTDQGQREEVNDPLAMTGREQRPDRSLALQGVRSPNVGDPTGGFVKQASALSTAMDGLSQAVAGVVEQKKEELITAGKTAYLSGVTEQEIKARGDRYTEQGYLHLQARDKVNNWFTNEAINIAEAGKRMAPAEYQAFLNDQRKKILDSITDSNGRKVAVAAFEELSPRLGQQHLVANNTYNKEQKVQTLSNVLISSARTNADTPAGPGAIKLTPTPVAPVIMSDPEERDIAIRTMLGEAQGEGAIGMAAVAHVLRNRATSAGGAWPKSIRGVALQDKQFTVWNNGAGGWAGSANNDPLYKKAGEVYDAVMSGRHVDPTGGATHYYSPEGMKAMGKEKPDWFDAEAGKAGGVVKIGGHVFAGKAAGGVTGEGRIRFANPNQDKLQPSVRTILTDTSAAVGKELVVLSGHRGEDHPVERSKMFRGYDPGEHSKGTASDIDMTGMSPKERQGLVRELRARGVMRFGTYSNMPNMLHIDMKDQQGDGSNWFMHDKTANKMDSAPAWIREIANEPRGSIAASPARTGTSMQNEVRAIALDGPTKAKTVADTIRRDLDAGSTAVFDSLGGIAFLRELQAAPSDIDEVIKAKTRHDQKQANNFSIEKVKFRDSILRRAGSMESPDVWLKDIDEARKRGQMDDTHATSLANEALNTHRSTGAGKSTVLDNPDFLQQIGGMYQKINSGGWDKGQIAKDATELAKKYGASDQDVKSIVGQMFNLDQAYQNKLRTEAQATYASAAAQALAKKNVADTLAKGVGLEHITGERIQVTNKNGNPATVSPKEFGIMQIKEKHAKDVSDEVAQGKLDPNAQKAELMKRTYQELQRQGVVDNEIQAQLKGHLSGNIIKKDGTISPESMQAYEAYSMLRNTPAISDAYISRTVEDSSVRSLLETAYLLDQGDLSPEQALRKAYEIVNDPLRDPEARIKKDAIWNTQLSTEIDKAIREKVAPSFWKSLVYNDSAIDAERVIKDNKGTITRYVQNRADMYHMQHPNEDPAVSRKKALDDFQANATYVAGNVIITPPGLELHKAMGISGLGRDAPDLAMRAFLDEAGPKLWPTKWGNAIIGGQTGESYVGAAARTLAPNMERALNPFPLVPSVVPRDAPVKITYDAKQGMIYMDLYSDSTRTKTLGAVKAYRVSEIGAWYAKTATQPTMVDRMFDKMFEAPAAMGRAIRSNTTKPTLGAVAGQAIADAP